MFLLLALLVTLPPALSREATEQCITYEPNTINLYGRITRKVFAGPPNYENVAKGDEAEQVWVLRLNRPVCVAAAHSGKQKRMSLKFNLYLARVAVNTTGTNHCSEKK